jgi:hypothetical protein
MKIYLDDVTATHFRRVFLHPVRLSRLHSPYADLLRRGFRSDDAGYYLDPAVFEEDPAAGAAFLISLIYDTQELTIGDAFCELAAQCEKNFSRSVIDRMADLVEERRVRVKTQARDPRAQAREMMRHRPC